MKTKSPTLRSPKPAPLAAFSLGTLVMLLAAVANTGCMSVKAYVDPKFRDAAYSQIKAPAQPQPIVLTVQFSAHDKPKPSVDGLLRQAVQKALATTRIFTESGDAASGSAGHLDVKVNNYGDKGSATGKGVATGLTLGLAGAEVVDNYQMTATYTPPSGSPVTKSYNHAIHSTIGVHSAPAGLEPVSNLNAAFNKVVEDMMLNFLRDVQSAGY